MLPVAGNLIGRQSRQVASRPILRSNSWDAHRMVWNTEKCKTHQKTHTSLIPSKQGATHQTRAKTLLVNSRSRFATSSSMHRSLMPKTHLDTCLARTNPICRSYVTQSATLCAKSKSSSSDPSSEDFIATALRSMMEKDGKVSKPDIRTALKQLKELEAISAARVLKSLSIPLGDGSIAQSSASSLAIASLPSSKLGPVVEESLARLLEVGFDISRLGFVFSHLSVLYPDWRVDGWENVIERYVVNKGYDPEAIAAILIALPRDLVCNFSIHTTSSDMIVAYETQVWPKHAAFANLLMGQENSPLWPADFYGRILGELVKRRPALLDETASIVAHMAFNVWNRAMPGEIPATEYETFVASSYFGARILSSVVQHSGKLSNGDIAKFLQVYNLKCLEHLKANAATLVKRQGFNTFEYIELVSITVAETAKRRKSKFNDIFLIKKCLDLQLDKWGADDVALASSSISSRFSISQFVRELLAERKATAASKH